MDAYDPKYRAKNKKGDYKQMSKITQVQLHNFLKKIKKTMWILKNIFKENWQMINFLKLKI